MHTTRVSLLSLLLLGTLLFTGGPAKAQDVGFASVDGFLSPAERFSGAMRLNNDGAYLLFRKDIGDGVGFQDGYSTLGLFAPVYQWDGGAIFTNGRLFLTDRKQVGVNALGGVRFRSDDGATILGFHAGFDSDRRPSGFRYDQFSAGVEWLRDGIEVRANTYAPLGTDENAVAIVAQGTNAFFRGNRIIFIDTALFEKALKGSDFEISIPVPRLEWMRISGGLYYYDAKNTSDPVGFRGRLEARLTSDMTAEMIVTDDRLFGTNVVLGLVWEWSGDSNFQLFPRREQDDKMLARVIKHYRVTVQERLDDIGVPAINPDNGRPYTVVHVDNSNVPGPGTGTFEDPFRTLTPAGPSGADIIIVHRGASSAVNPVTGATVLSDNQRVLGEGFPHTFEALDRGVFFFPGLAQSGGFPVLSAPGTMITLADNNEVAALDMITQLGGRAIGGAGIEDFNLHNLNVSGPGGGVELANASGQGRIAFSTFDITTAGAPGPISITNIAAPPLDVTIENIDPADGGLRGIDLVADASRIDAEIMNVRADGNGTGMRLISRNGGFLDANVANSEFNNATGAAGASGHGIEVLVQTGSFLGLTMNRVDGMNAAADGFNAQVTGGSQFQGVFTDNNFDNAGVNGIFLSADASVFNTLTMVRPSADNAATGDGLHIEALNGSTWMVDVTDGSFVNAGDDAIDVVVDGASDVDLFVDPTPATDAGANGFRFAVTDGSTLDAFFDQTDFSRAGANGILGTLDNGGVVNLAISDSAATDSFLNGMFVTATNNSIFNATIDDTPFNNSGLTTAGNAFRMILGTGSRANLTLDNADGLRAGGDAIFVDASGGSILVATATNSSFANAGSDGLDFDVSGASQVAFTMTNGSFDDAGEDAIDGMLTGGSTAQLIFTDTTGNRAARHGLLLDLTDSTLLTSTFIRSGFNDSGSTNNGNAVRITMDNSAGDLTFVDTTGDRSGSDGLFLSAVNTSNFTGSFTNGSFSDSGQDPASALRNGLNVTADASTVALTLVDTPAVNTPGNTTQVDGLHFVAQNGANFTASVRRGSFSDNLNNAVDGMMTGAGTLATVTLDSTIADNSGADGLLLDVRGGARLDFNFLATDNPGSVSDSGGNGVAVIARGSGTPGDTRANLNFVQTTIDDNALDGFTTDPLAAGDPSNGAFVTASFTGGSLSGNAGQGIDIAVGDPLTATDLDLNGTTVDNNGREGLLFAVTGGGRITVDVVGGSFSSNGSLVASDGVRGIVQGAGSTATANFDGTTVDSNTQNGFNFTVDSGGTLVATLMSSAANGTLSASNNINSGVRLDADDAGTVANLLMSGQNNFDSNGLVPGVDGIDIDADNVSQLVASITGNVTNSGADGVNILLNNVTLAAISVASASPDEISDNAGDGIDIVFNNSRLNNVTVGSTTVPGLSIDGLEIDSNAGFGIRIVGTDSLIVADTGIITNNLISNSAGGDGLLFQLVRSQADGFRIVGNGSEDNFGNGINVDLTDSPLDRLTIEDNDIGASVNIGLTFFIDGDTFTQPFEITNSSDPGVQLTRFQFDVAPAGRIFNTQAPGGVPFTPVPPTDTITGLATVNGTAVPPFPPGLVPDFSTLLDLAFTDFDPTESLQWNIDVDTVPGVDATITGADLIGSTVVVDFTGGLQLSGALVAVPGNPDASIFVATGGITGAGGVSDNGADGIIVTANNSDLTNLSVSRNQASDNADSGIEIEAINSAVDGNIDENTTSGNGEGGIVFNFTDATLTNTTVNGNTSNNNTDDGILFNMIRSPINNLVVADSASISNNARHGINFQLVESDATDIAVAQGNIADNAASGINFDITDSDVSGAITGNSITGNGVDGITINTTNTNPGAGRISVDFGSVAGREIAGNTIDNNAQIGINADINEGVDFFADLTGNTISNHGSFGMLVQATDDAGVNLDIGGPTAGDGDTFDNNVDAAVGLEFSDNVTANLTVGNSTFTGTTDNPATANFGGDGIRINLSDNVVMGSVANPVFIEDSTFSGHEGDGLALSTFDNVNVPLLRVEGSAFSSNTGHGVSVVRRGLATVNVTIGGAGAGDGSTFTSNTLDGFNFLATNTTSPVPSIVTVQNSTFTGNRDGVSITAQADAIILPTITTSTFANQLDNGVRLTAQNNSSIGDSQLGIPAILDGNTFTGNGSGGTEAGVFADVQNDAFLDVLISGVAQRSTFTGNQVGVRFQNSSTFNTGIVTQRSRLTIQGTDFDNSTGDQVSIVQSGTGGSDIFIGGAAAGQDVTMTRMNDDGIDSTFVAGTNTFTVVNTTISNPVLTPGTGDDGISVAHAGGITTVTIDDTTIQRMGGDGIEFADTGGLVLATITNSTIELNDGRGIAMEVNKVGGSSYTIGGVGAGNTIVNNGLQGVAHLARSTLDGAGSFTRIADTDPLPFRHNLASADNLVTNLIVLGNTIQSNGNANQLPNTDGLVLGIGSNVRVNALVAGNTFGGNVDDDVRIFPFVSVNPQDSIFNPDPAPPNPPSPDTFFFDPVAHLDLVFGARDTNGDNIPDLTNDPTTINVGNSIQVTNVGSAATDGMASFSTSGLFTNNDVFKGANRTVLLNAQVQIVNQLNNPFNQFSQAGVFQNIQNTFLGAGFTLNPAQVFPDPLGPPF